MSECPITELYECYLDKITSNLTMGFVWFRFPVAEPGFYKACFDNTFSHFSHKTVAFHMSVDSDDDTHWKDYDDNNFQPDVQVYDVQVNDIKVFSAIFYKKSQHVLQVILLIRRLWKESV